MKSLRDNFKCKKKAERWSEKMWKPKMSLEKLTGYFWIF